MKKKHTLLLMALFLTGVAFGQNSPGPDVKSTENPGITWMITHHVDCYYLNPEAVPVAIFDFDPMEAFLKTLDVKKVDEDLKKAATWRDSADVVAMWSQVCWSMLFDKVKGGDVQLWTRTPEMTSCYGDLNAPKEKKWIVAQTTNISNGLISFVVPVELGQGSKHDICLNKSNLVDFNSVYFKKIKKMY